MQKPVKSIQNVFSAARAQLKIRGMTWYIHFINKQKTNLLRAEGEAVRDADRAKGPIACDLQPCIVWARQELHNEAATVGTLGIAVSLLIGRRGCEIRYKYKKHSEFEILISHLAKQRGALIVESDEDLDEEDDADKENTVQEAVPPELKLGDSSFVILCLAPADDVLIAIAKLCEMIELAGLSEKKYSKQLANALPHIEVMQPIIDTWHFHRQFVPHNNRCVYVAYLQWMLGEQGRWPKGHHTAACIKKYLGHKSMDAATNYYKVVHSPASNANFDSDIEEVELEIAALTARLAFKQKRLQRKRKRLQ
jgi:hypothetical protein